MRTASPWWASLVLGVGLLFVFLGQRLFGYQDGGIASALTWIGVLGVVAVTGASAWAMLGSTGGRRRVERTLLVAHVGTLLALAVYALSTAWGQNLFHVTGVSATHFHGALTVVWAALLLASIVPVLMIELSLGVARREAFDVASRVDDAGVEYFRVRDIGWSGLSVALAAALLMVTCQVANERNISRDVSYFKTASPGESTRNIAAASSEPIKVLLFFPEVNEVKDQVKGYFQSLGSTTEKLVLEEHDRIADAEIAAKYKVTKDGTIVFVRGTGDKEKSQTIDVDTDFDKARRATSKLRTFDKDVNTVLVKLAREKRKVYFVTGHGELNDPASVPESLKGVVLERGTVYIKKRIADLNFEAKDLGLIDLANEVPDDATVVVLLGPSAPLREAEWASLGRYLDRGGSLLVALEPLDPKLGVDLGPLQGRLGVKQLPGVVTDEEKFVPTRRVLADRRWALTNQFSSHASTTAISQRREPLLLVSVGALDDAPVTGKDAPKKTYTIKTMDSSFLDLDGNYSFDGATEKKQKWNIAAALEGPKVGDKEGYRVLVYGGANLFIDLAQQTATGQMVMRPVSDGLDVDAIRWLGREEVFSGDIVTEEDKPIAHTKNADTAWFTLMTVGAPILVLALGIVGTRARKRRGSKKGKVSP